MSWQTHAAAAALVMRGPELLLVRQRRPSGTWWEVPGGYLEPGESFEQAAAREASEETGVEVEAGELLCTLVWERESDRRRNVVAYVAATPIADAPELRPQTEEGIDAVAFFDFRTLDIGGVHPLERPILARLFDRGFVLHADVAVAGDGSHTYTFR